MTDKRDDFWDIGMLLPERKLRPYVSGDTSTVEIEAGEEDGDGQPRKAVIPPKRETGPEGYGYTPARGSIKSVRVEQWQSKYALYADFAEQALVMTEKSASGAEYVYFFSYRSQYSELNREQTAWYLTWREAVRNGTYPKTGLSYILLYIYEMINLSDVLEPPYILDQIIKLWISYRDSFSRLDKYLSEWVVDFSLIHKLEPDLTLFEPFLGDVMANTMLKEFYFDLEGCIENGRIEQLLSLTSAYNYKDSKFYTGEHIPLFDAHVPEMLRLMLRDKGVSDYLSKLNVITSNVTREAFTGAVCAFKYKKRIFCSVYSYLRSYDFRQLMTGAAKYAENAIRAYLGIKSRLYQIDLPNEARAALDGYIRRHLTRPSVSERKVKDTREDEAPPPPREVNIDLSAAASIEQESWDTTRRLVELQSEDGGQPSDDSVRDGPGYTPRDDGPDIPEAPPGGGEQESGPSPDGLPGLIRVLDADELDFLMAALIHDDTDRERQTDAVAARCRSMPELLIERINEKSLGTFGDILIDMGTRVILEDYFEPVKEIFDEQ